MLDWYNNCLNKKRAYPTSLSASKWDVELTSQCQRYQKEAVTVAIGSGTAAVVADNGSDELSDGI